MYSHTYRKGIASTFVFKFISGYRVYSCPFSELPSVPPRAPQAPPSQGVDLSGRNLADGTISLPPVLVPPHLREGRGSQGLLG